MAVGPNLFSWSLGYGFVEGKINRDEEIMSQYVLKGKAGGFYYGLCK